MAEERSEERKVSSLTDKKWVLLPLAWYTPATSLGFGGVVIRNLNFQDSRPSNVQVALAYTLRNQILAYVPFQIYAKNNKIFLEGELGYYDYIYDFYGIGNHTREIDHEDYSLSFFRLRFSPAYMVRKNIYLGLKVLADVNNFRTFAEEGSLSQGDILGTEDSSMFGIGYSVSLDDRDDVYYPSKGHLISLSTYWSDTAFGSDYTFSRTELNAAKYIPIRESWILATQFFFATMTGDPPFNFLADIGGSKLGRGYRSGRFRDKALLLLQAELRFPIHGNFKAATFASLGRVSSEIATMSFRNLHPAGGFGLRYQLGKENKLNLRADLGFGQNSWGFYFIVGEAF